MSDASAEHDGHAQGQTNGHSHDDVEWAAQAALLTASDDLEVGRNQAIVDFLGVGDGDVAVEVGSGAGGMAAALLGAVGTAGTVIIVDGAAELLTVAQRRARRPGHHLVALHADIDSQPLGTVLEHRRPVDLVYASAVVHHLDDELAAVRHFASVVRPGGRVAVAEGGLGHRYLPDDCGIGEPGLEQRLAAAHEAWFWSEVRPAKATVRRPWGWNVLLAEAGLTDVATRSFLLDVPPPLDAPTRQGVRAVFERELATLGDRISDEDRATLARLLDDDDPHSVMRRPDVFVLNARTVHAGTVPDADGGDRQPGRASQPPR
jgi:ubiquinone/menaquinone biosynthesis C-methylase UbiE